jgi:hypothetical protein
MSFSMAGMRIERSLRSLLAAVFYDARVSRVPFSASRDGPLNASQLVLWAVAPQWLVVGGVDPPERRLWG